MNRWLAVALAVTLIASGCSDDEQSAPSTSSPTTPAPTSTASPTTPSTEATTSPTTASPSTTPPSTSNPSTTQPPTTQPSTTTTPEQLEPVLQRLLDRYDAAVTAILTNPRVAADPSHAAVREYLALFASDSSFAQGALASWAAEGEQGRFYRAGPGGELVDSTLRDVNGSSDEQASFTVCSANSMEIVDADGNLIESQGGVAFVEVVAVRVDDEWVFRDLTQSSGDCPRPGTDE